MRILTVTLLIRFNYYPYLSKTKMQRQMQSLVQVHCQYMKSQI